ncbi:MAG: peptidoglycan-binding protein [Hyphomicrobiales bacterium]|nr:peptidoglycan-binding protein [Hyphomicrobiales bacterium]
MKSPQTSRHIAQIYIFGAALMVVFAVAAQSSVRAQTTAPAFGWPEFVQALRVEAIAAGIKSDVFDRIYARLSPDCKQPGVYCSGGPQTSHAFASFRAKGLPESCFKVTQREFLRPGEYFPESSMRSLALRGQALLKGWKAQKPEILQAILKIEATYQIDHKLLLALWGRETNYGQFALTNNAVRALSSMAYAGAPARRAWARRQAIAALKMVSDGRVTMEKFKSSYAGATGLTQILPVEYLERGVDGDGDGRIDIWESVPDALATTANILQNEGWQGAQKTWGQEVRLPKSGAGADCTLEGRPSRRTRREWTQTQGIAQATGAASSGGHILDPQDPGYLVLPAGARGPAFLATDNFEVLRRYNTSDVYAVFIGLTANRIGCETEKGACAFERAWPVKSAADDFEFSVENLCRLQISLKARGFSDTTPDGLFGRATRVAIGKYQKSLQKQPDCYPTKAIYRELVEESSVIETPQR